MLAALAASIEPLLDVLAEAEVVARGDHAGVAEAVTAAGVGHPSDCCSVLMLVVLVEDEVDAKLLGICMAPKADERWDERGGGEPL